jgi:hypothetical protein
MTGKDRMTLLDIDLDLVFEPVPLEEAVDRGNVVIILVLGRLLRLRLDQDRALEADLVLVLDHQVEETSELVVLALEVGVEQGLVAFAPAPQHVVGATELVGRIDAGLHCRSREGKNVRIRIGRCPRHVAPVGKQVGRAPQQLHAGGFLLAGEIVDDLFEVLRILGKVGTFRTHIGIMEAVERCTQRREHLEGNIRLQLGKFHRVLRIPRPVEGAPAKRVAAFPGEGMPVGNGKAQMVFHPLAHDHLVGVVMAEGQRIAALRPLVLDPGDVSEKSCAHDMAPLIAG